MHQLTIQISDGLLGKLREQAEIYDMSVDEWIVDRLETITEPDALNEAERLSLSAHEQIDMEWLSEEERMEKFLRESGLFATPENKIGPELEKLARPVSEAERKHLAEALSKGKSLSEMIIEDRGE